MTQTAALSLAKKIPSSAYSIKSLIAYESASVDSYLMVIWICGEYKGNVLG